MVISAEVDLHGIIIVIVLSGQPFVERIQEQLGQTGPQSVFTEDHFQDLVPCFLAGKAETAEVLPVKRVITGLCGLNIIHPESVPGTDGPVKTDMDDFIRYHLYFISRVQVALGFGGSRKQLHAGNGQG